MTVAVDVAELDLATDGVSKVFALTGPGGGMALMSAADLLVWFIDADGAATQLTYAVDFSISGDIRNGAGSLTTLAVSAYADEGRLACRRNTPRTQTEAWADNDGFAAATMQNAQDRGRLIDQDAAMRGKFAISTPLYEMPPDPLPDAIARAGKPIVFDDEGRVGLGTMKYDVLISVVQQLLGSVPVTGSPKILQVSKVQQVVPDIVDMAAAAAAAGAVLSLDVDYVLTADSALDGAVRADGGKFTLGDFDLTGDIWGPPNSQIFICNGTGVVALKNLWRVPSSWFGVTATNDDNIDELNATAACVSASGGGTFEVPGGDIKISDLLAPPTGVALVGQGNAFNGSVNYGGTRFLCTSASAGIAIGGAGHDNASDGGKCGGFVVDGGGVATKPFTIGRAVCRMFEDILVRNSADYGYLLQETQNCRFYNCNVDACAGAGLAFDAASAGNTLYGHENNACGTGIAYLNTYNADGLTHFTANNQIFGCLIERTTTGKVIFHDAGEDNMINGLNASVFNVGIDSDSNFIELTSTHSVRFKLTNLTGLTGEVLHSTCFKVASGATLIVDRPGKINAFLNVFDLDTGSLLDMDGKPDFGTNTNKYKAGMTGTKNTVLRHRQYGTIEQTLPTSTENARIVLVDGEAGQRTVEYSGGLGFTKDGTSFNPAKGISSLATGTGTIPSGSTSIAIAHGFSSQPSRPNAFLTGGTTNDPGNVWATADATNITVHCRSDPGAGGLPFRWEAFL